MEMSYIKANGKKIVLRVRDICLILPFSKVKLKQSIQVILKVVS